MIQSVWQDLRYAVRVLRRSPLFVATVVFSLAIGLGANATIFGLVDALFFTDPPGIPHPERLVQIGRSQDGQDFDNNSYANYVDLRDRNAVLEEMAAFRFEPVATGLGGLDAAERIYSQTVSGNYFATLQVSPAAGRFFAADEDTIGGNNEVVVLSHRLWETRFGADPKVVGQSLILNGKPFGVIGVAPKGFRGISLLAPDVWIPIHSVDNPFLVESRRAVWLQFLGRLKPDVSVQQARAALKIDGEALEREFPEENKGRGIVVAPLSLLPPPIFAPVAGFMGLLTAIVGLVLVIACVNVAGMLLARATTRRGEVAVRLSLGAARSRLVRQFLTESVLLFLLGGAVGLVFFYWMKSGLLALVPQLPVPIELDVSLGGRVTAFVALLTLCTGVVSGLVPALRATRGDLAGALKEDGGKQQFGRLRLRGLLVTGQVALSLLILLVAGLLVRSLREASSIDPGFDPDGVDLVSLDLSLAGYNEKTGLAFAERLMERVSSLPGVESTSYCRQLPLSGGGFSLGGIVVPGQEDPDRPRGEGADWNIVSEDYFRTLSIPLARGRSFGKADRFGSAPVAIVNETFANRFWPGQDPIGQVFYDDEVGKGTARTIVGVARDGKYRSLGEAPRLFVYVPLRQVYTPEIALLIRGRGELVPTVRKTLREMDPNLPIVDAQALGDFVGVGLIPQRVALSVAGGLGMVTLLLAALGIYGVSAYAANRRRREMGIRAALGATRRDLLRLMLRHGLGLAAAGVLIGLVVGLLTTRVLRDLLYGVSANDPLTFGLAASLFLAVAFLGGWFPARRAAATDPAQALRYE